MSEKAVEVLCSHCEARLKVKNDSALGKKIRCPSCNEVFVAAPSANGNAPQPAKLKRRSEGGEQAANEAGAEAAPKKKKRKKKKTKEVNPIPYVIGAMALLLLLIGGAVFAAVKMFGKPGGGTAAKAVAPLETATYRNRVFSVQHPADWTQEEGGAENYKWVKFTKGSSAIKVQEDLGGSILADIHGRDKEKNDTEESAVAKIHASSIESIKGDFGDKYTEEAAVPFTTKFGEGRRSAFKVPGTFGSIRGYRATIMGGVKNVYIRCTCSASEWDSLKPAFEKLIDSVGPGGRG